MKEAAFRGLMVGLGKISLSRVGVGGLIKKCVDETRKWHSGGNTNLGIVTLLVPLTVGAGIFKVKNVKFNVDIFRGYVEKVCKATTVKDAVDFYEAVELAKTGGLGKIQHEKAPDVTSKTAKEEIFQKEITLYRVMKTCSKWDTICKEWVTRMKITFKTGYPTIKKVYMETKNFNLAITQCFLTILAQHPDSLIARKNGLDVAKKVSEEAKKILKVGGTLTSKGRKMAEELDLKLRTPDNRLNPGTTADLTVSSTMVCLLSGIKP